MTAIKVPSHIRDAPLPKGYVWHDGDEIHWPVLKYNGNIVAVATIDTLHTSRRASLLHDKTTVENIDQAFNLINARILLGEGHETSSD